MEPISFRWYLISVLKGLIYWPGFAIFALFVPIIGWLFIPTIPFFPLFFPIIERFAIRKKQKQLLDRAEDELFVQEFRKSRKK